MYNALNRQYTLASHAIRDLKHEVSRKEFTVLVDNLVNASWGMNWSSWWQYITWNCSVEGGRGGKNRMEWEEERRIVFGLAEMWLTSEMEDFGDVGENVRLLRKLCQ